MLGHHGGTALGWIERVLLTAGLVLGLWSALSVAEARYFSSLPPPALSASLPGEDATATPAVLGESLTRGEWVARLEAPTVELTATVLEGSDSATLARAAGRIEYTALPGSAGNVGIAGHRDTVFRPVRRLQVGDPLILTTASEILEYRVDNLRVVEPEDVHVLDPTGHPTLTLVTCYPFNFIGSAPKRYIVSASLATRRARAGDPRQP